MLYLTAFQHMPSSFSAEFPLCCSAYEQKCLVSSHISFTTVRSALAVRLVFIGKAGWSKSSKLIGK